MSVRRRLTGALCVAGLSLAAATGGAIAAPAMVPGAAASTSAQQADTIARCIVQHLQHGSQVYHAHDGSLQGVAFGPRAKAIRWTIRTDRDGYHVRWQGDQVGAERSVRGICY